MCVSIAQAIVSQMDECREVDAASVGVLPWWHRIFYLHLASTVLITARLRNELTSSPLASQSWNQAMTALQAHEHLSSFVGQCIASFETLASKISSATAPSRDNEPLISQTASVQEIYHDMTNLEIFAFGIDDMTWLDRFD